MNADYKTINVPQSDVNDLMSTLVEWHVSNNDYVKVGDVVCTMETSKLVFDVESEYVGYVYLLREEGDEICTSEPLVLVAESIDELNKYKEVFIAGAQKDELEGDSRSDKSKATKKAVSKAEELNVDLADIDIEGIIREKDVTDYYGAVEKVSSGERGPRVDESLIEKKIKFIGNRKIGKDLMLESKKSIPHSYVEREMDVTCLVNYIENMIKGGEGYMTPLSIILYSLGRALLKHKEFNSFREDDSVVYYRHINVGVVVNVENSLSVPILDDIDEMDPLAILKKLFEMRKKLMTGKINAGEFVGGTFTVSAMDHTSVGRFIPIIHPKQAGVLAVPKIQKKYELVSEGNMAIKDFINMGLSFDHTFLNAMQGIEFLDAIESEIHSYVKGGQL
jgi:pyruvate/2-oxoglutarate dehydrogenase complex dihydrolipoamide acyltransferase (E2) component